MQPTAEQMNKLKILELDMLKHFIAVCQQLNLKYYIICGTLLGAVRHKGFSPWDDDIDVAMFRDDYEIFVREGQKYLPKRYFIQTNKTDPQCPINFAKIRDCETTYMEVTVQRQKMNHGVFIDVFPLDKHPDNTGEVNNFKRKNDKLNKIIRKVFTVDRRVGLLRFMFHRFINFLPHKKSWREALEEQDKLIQANVGDNYVANYCGDWDKETFPKQWYGEGVELLFEGIKVNAPKEYKAWLNQVYGNYMELPPESQRVAHHYVKIIDLQKSYKEYSNE